MLLLLGKTALVYIAVNIAIRCMGKRQVGELSPSEVIIAFLISEVATAPLGDPEISLLHTLAAILMLVAMEILYSYISIKSPFFMALTQGTPTVIIENGIILEKELLRNRLTIAELNEELRLKNINISDVYLAIIENNGQLSIIPTNESAGVTRRDLGVHTKESPQDFAVIIDGQILQDNLQRVGKNMKFLESELKKRKISSPKDVLAMYADKNGVTFFQKKMAKEKKSVQNGKKYKQK